MGSTEVFPKVIKKHLRCVQWESTIDEHVQLELNQGLAGGGKVCKKGCQRLQFQFSYRKYDASALPICQGVLLLVMGASNNLSHRSHTQFFHTFIINILKSLSMKEHTSARKTEDPTYVYVKPTHIYEYKKS